MWCRTQTRNGTEPPLDVRKIYAQVMVMVMRRRELPFYAPPKQHPKTPPPVFLDALFSANFGFMCVSITVSNTCDVFIETTVSVTRAHQRISVCVKTMRLASSRSISHLS